MRRRIAVAVAGVLVLGLAIVAGAGLLLRQPTQEEAPHGLQVVHTPSPPEAAPPPEGAPNVVVVIACTLRRDQLSLYDETLETAPWLDAMARNGVVFDDVITAAPWTRPASTAILTGRHALTIGMVEPLPGMNRRSLPDEVTTLAEHFRAHGWRTYGGTANPNLASVWNMNQGFDQYVEPAATWAEGVRHKMPANLIGQPLLEALDADPRTGPVYLQLMLIEAHAPWPDRDTPAPEGVPEDVHRYRGGVLDLDRAVQTLHLALRERGITRENTLFVVVNDHGEGIRHPAHHGPGHGRFLYPSTVGGVWVMAGPGLPDGVRVDGVVSQVDIFPTVAELAGVPAPPLPDGVSQAPALASGHSLREVAWSDTWFQHVSRAARYTDELACHQDWSPFKATTGGSFEPGCFDRRVDPWHLASFDEPEAMAELERWRAARQEEMAAFTGASDADPTEATLRHLEALGYVEDGDGVPEED